ncbi:MAG: 3-hydroxyacyl-CoA dehydrogenase [Hyphomicrobiales bacterium]|nr:MAG: 3-hydroxyacyl-CoA dehydrogenase [Hyphomicrobiales bacterium]
MTITIERAGPYGLVNVDHPPVNALSQAVRRGLLDAVRAMDADPEVRAVILACKGRTFIAGADVKEFGQPPAAPHLPDVIAAIENADKPWLAAIHGSALGGGFELALGCAWRLMDRAARIGLPEVTLGLIPGAGGTVRLPRLIGAEAALEMAAGGKPAAAEKALALGAADGLFEGDPVAAASSFLDRNLAAGRPMPLSRREAARPAPEFWPEQQRKWQARAAGQKAPLAALEAVRRGVEADFEAAMAFERQSFLNLRESDQAAALRHMFFAERAAAKLSRLAGAPPRPLALAGVVGGGTMGAGIAAALLGAGLAVVLAERDKDALARGLAGVERILTGAKERGLIDEGELEARRARLSGTLDHQALGKADLVIEAVFEDLELKRRLFAELEQAVSPACILATNTSYLNPDEIARDCSAPERFLGLHFFSPAHIMKLLEIVRGAHTAPDVLATGFALAKKLGKVGVLAGICDGFIGNRILKTYRRQADCLLMEGCLPGEVDAAMRDFGMRMGPYEAQDLGGLDIAWANRKAAGAAQEHSAAIADRLCEMGRFGQKTGRGWYRYQAGSRRPEADPEVERVILEEAAAAGIQRRGFSPEEIRQRLLFPMVNEAARILEEGIAERPLDIDLVEVHGYGFPRWRGGLMHWADRTGPARIRDAIRQWHGENAATDAPAELLQRLAQTGEDFSSLN